jgi:hypothetical protein
MIPNGWAQYGEEAKTEEVEIGVKRQGVVHNIAEDRRVERIAGGLYEPEGLDIYLKRHIDKLTGQITGLETQVTEMKADLKVIRQMVQEKPENAQPSANEKPKNPQSTIVS